MTPPSPTYRPGTARESRSSAGQLGTQASSERGLSRALGVFLWWGTRSLSARTWWTSVCSSRSNSAVDGVLVQAASFACAIATAVVGECRPVLGVLRLRPGMSVTASAPGNNPINTIYKNAEASSPKCTTSRAASTPGCSPTTATLVAYWATLLVCGRAAVTRCPTCTACTG